METMFGIQVGADYRLGYYFYRYSCQFLLAIKDRSVHTMKIFNFEMCGCSFFRYQKLRNLVHQYMTVNPKLFGGEGATVEVDLFSWSKNNGPFILGGVARHSGKKPRECFFEVVKNTEQKTLLPIVKKYVKPGTTVISSCFKDETKQMETVQPFNHVSISSSQRKLMPKVPDLLLILSLWDSLRARIAAHGSMMNSNRAHDSMWPSVLSNSLWLELHSDAFDATLQTIADVYKF